jgi:uncharacterized membrane protein
MGVALKMPYFEKTKKLSIILFILCGFFALLTIIGFGKSYSVDILRYNYTNDIRGTIFTVISFVFSVFSLLVGIALRYIAIDAKEDLGLINEKIWEYDKKNM